MNDLATSKSSNAVAALGGLGQALSNVVNTTATSSGDPFLRLQKDGVWVYGAKNVEVEPGSHWAVNPLSIKHGYACWTNKDPKLKQKNELLGEAMVPATLPKPDVNTLPKHPFEWAEQVSFQLQCVSGEDAGEQTLFKTTSVGGKNASVKLLGEIIARIAEATDGTVVPVIELLSDSYQHPTYGKTFVPIFKVVGWRGMDAAPKAEELGPEPANDPAPFDADPAPVGAPVRRRRN